MKYNFFKPVLAIATGTLLLAGTGCNKLEDFGDTNLNPLGSTSPITAALLTNAQVSLGGTAVSVRPAIFVQYVAETQYTDVSLYSEPKLEFGGTFSGPMYDLQSIINRNSNPATAAANTGSGSNANQIAVAKIMMTYYMWTTTDRWGDVPYDEALKGAGNFTPKFDEQSKIYERMVTDLKAAVVGFDAGLPVRGDIMYGGDAAKWKKLANSLRMQIALRLSKKFPNAGQYAATQFAAAANDPAGFIASNADNFTIKYPGGAAYRNPWFDTYNGRSDYAFSKTFADILGNMGDSRRSAFGSAGTPFPYGLTRAQATTLPVSYSMVLDGPFRTESSPVVVISAANTLLTLAEGLERGWTTVTGYTAQSAYEAGVTASFDQWGISGAAAYVAGSAAKYGTGTGGGTGIGVNSFNNIPAASNAVTTTNLQRIALQRYIALFPDGTQAWSEWRRTGVPDIRATTLATNDAAGKTIPRRYVYGQLEYSLNPAQLQVAIGRLTGGDVMNGKVWWDQ